MRVSCLLPMFPRIKLPPMFPVCPESETHSKGLVEKAPHTEGDGADVSIFGRASRVLGVREWQCGRNL